MRARSEELEQLLLRSQEQAGSLKDEVWNLEQRLEEASRTKVEVEHECARLIQEMRALRLQQEDGEASMEHLRAIVRKTEADMMQSVRQSEEGSMDIAKLRMSNAELQGRLNEAEQPVRRVVVAGAGCGGVLVARCGCRCEGGGAGCVRLGCRPRCHCCLCASRCGGDGAIVAERCGRGG